MSSSPGNIIFESQVHLKCFLILSQFQLMPKQSSQLALYEVCIEVIRLEATSAELR